MGKGSNDTAWLDDLAETNPDALVEVASAIDEQFVLAQALRADVARLQAAKTAHTERLRAGGRATRGKPKQKTVDLADAIAGIERACRGVLSDADIARHLWDDVDGDSPWVEGHRPKNFEAAVWRVHRARRAKT